MFADSFLPSLFSLETLKHLEPRISLPSRFHCSAPGALGEPGWVAQEFVDFSGMRSWNNKRELYRSSGRERLCRCQLWQWRSGATLKDVPP